MLDSFTGGGYYEYPSFEVALFSILLSFVLSSLIAFTYHLTNRGGVLSRYFIQAMILSAIVTCMVIMAVGNNIAAGFGIIGAIAIIRFRMRVENPRNIIFIFAALSVGIASGVYGYAIAMCGAVIFCVVAVILYYSPYGSKRLNQEFTLSFVLDPQMEIVQVNRAFEEKCDDFRMLSIAARPKGNRYEFFLTLKQGVDKQDFFDFLQAWQGMSNIRLERSDNLARL